MVLSIPVKSVAGYFIIVGITGTIGRFVFSALPLLIGRRHAGEVMGWGAAILMLFAGIYHGAFIAGVPAFIVWLAAAAVFVNGGFSNMSPYACESYPVRLAARAAGLAQAANGVGKILGPLCLGVIAGSGNVVNPSATEQATLPAFMFLSACALVAGLAYRFLPIETHGRTLALKEAGEVAAH
jgi:putative MFS transporter